MDQQARTVVDQMGRQVQIPYSVKRIVSLVPSQTELLFDLGLDHEIVGVTKFCVHPADKVISRTKIGGTKKINIEQIRSLRPDLIIGNKEENQKEQIEELIAEFPVWMSDIYNLEDAKTAIKEIGGLVDRKPEAAYLNHLITAGFNDLQTLAAQKGISKSVAYCVWKNPYMFAGKHTFIDCILQSIGLTNIVRNERYPVLEVTDLEKLEPDYIFLSSEPYPFDAKHVVDIEEMFPNAHVRLVDGEMFSWYGSRLIKSIHYLFKLQTYLH